MRCLELAKFGVACVAPPLLLTPISQHTTNETRELEGRGGERTGRGGMPSVFGRYLQAHDPALTPSDRSSDTQRLCTKQSHFTPNHPRSSADETRHLPRLSAVACIAWLSWGRACSSVSRRFQLPCVEYQYSYTPTSRCSTVFDLLMTDAFSRRMSRQYVSYLAHTTVRRQRAGCSVRAAYFCKISAPSTGPASSLDPKRLNIRPELEST
jgi:hypothetical protein